MLFGALMEFRGKRAGNDRSRMWLPQPLAVLFNHSGMFMMISHDGFSQSLLRIHVQLIQDCAPLPACSPHLCLMQSQQEQKVALVWDERMELHEEGKVCPHPERPDRVRAVMSRLLASQLAGTKGCGLMY